VDSGSAILGSGSVTTGANGRASVLVTAGASPGNVVIRARFGSLAPVVFNLVVRALGPVLTATSFLNGASLVPGVVPGSVVVITGQGIAQNVQNCVIPVSIVGALPFELAGVSVQWGPDSSPLFSPFFWVCNNSNGEAVAVQAPVDLPLGTAQATVRVAGGGSTTVTNIPVAALQPGIFENTGANNLRYAVVVRPNGSYVSPQNPARRGEILRLFATGLGPVNPPFSTGTPGAPGQMVLATPVVGVNNEGVRVVGAEYAVGMVGIYVVTFEMPMDTTVGSNRPLGLGVYSGSNIIYGNGSSIAIQ
jgi:uncharacterized protein (TIGR03437 family)